MENIQKKGRPVSRKKPKTLFSSRLQDVIPIKSLRELSIKYFCGASEKTVSKYLSGDAEPTVSQVLRIAEVTGCDLMWLLTGEKDMDKESS